MENIKPVPKYGEIKIYFPRLRLFSLGRFLWRTDFGVIRNSSRNLNRGLHSERTRCGVRDGPIGERSGGEDGITESVKTVIV